MLDGNITGDILTDDRDNPSWGLVRESADGSVYLGGDLEATTLNQLVARLRRTGDVLIGAWPGDAWPEGLPPNPDYVGRVLEFVDRPGDDAALEALSRKIPKRCVLRSMDRELIEQSAQRDHTIQGFGSVDRFVENGLGSVLMRGKEVLCEASAGPVVMRLREIGVFTHAPHRGRGYATATCAHLVRKIESAGLQTYWNCAKQNSASATVARKLGYRLEREYKLLAWFESK